MGSVRFSFALPYPLLPSERTTHPPPHSAKQPPNLRFPLPSLSLLTVLPIFIVILVVVDNQISAGVIAVDILYIVNTFG